MVGSDETGEKVIKPHSYGSELELATGLLARMQKAARYICTMTFEDSNDFESLEYEQIEQADGREQLRQLLHRYPEIIQNDGFQKELSTYLELELLVQSKIRNQQSLIKTQMVALQKSKQARKTYDQHYDVGYGYFVDKQK